MPLIAAKIAQIATVPIVAALLYSFSGRWTSHILPDYYTLEHWRDALSDERLLGALWRTTWMALAVLLLVGATMLIRSFLGLQKVSPGFTAEGVQPVAIECPWEGVIDPERVAARVKAEGRIAGHVPGAPLMPGVVMCEAAAQVCSYHALKHDLFIIADEVYRRMVALADRQKTISDDDLLAIALQRSGLDETQVLAATG